MRVGIDATWAAIHSGTGTYVDGLVRALASAEREELLLYFRSGDEETNALWNLRGPTVSRKVVDGLGQPGRSLISLARAARRDEIDVFHSPGYFLPLWDGPKVVTFHDVNMFLEWDKWWRQRAWREWLSICVQTLLSSRSANLILADSRDSARDICRVLRLPNDRVEVLYPGIDDRYFKPASNSSYELRRDHGLERYLLFVSVISPIKNLEGVINSLRIVNRPEIKLAVLGREVGGYYTQVIVPLVRRLGLENQVKFLGTAAPDVRHDLYSHAEMLVFPSFHEGFGFPPLEAMASGTPVVGSTRPCLPEVLGDGALLVDPSSVEEIAAAVMRILDDTSLRHGLIKRGRERAMMFRWADRAEEAARFYRRVAEPRVNT